MVTETIKLVPVESCKRYIDQNVNFVLQGGAGSGKTETLKELLLYIKVTKPKARVVCITHTNVAVDEIAGRVGDGFIISTIHSFLNNLIKDYKKNIKTVIPSIFKLQEMSDSVKTKDQTDGEFKKAVHDKYKKIYEKYASLLFDLKNETVSKVAGKREYDKNPKEYNGLLNAKIREINAEIGSYIDKCDYTKILYNETKFNNYKDVSFGHDGLLEVFHLLFEKYDILKKLIKDNYDYIFIDEYQDSNENVVKDLLSIANDNKISIALFGDAMQAIYPDGIGNAKNAVDEGNLIQVEKPDNFRCSFEVLDLINSLRLDKMKQKVALKRLPNGDMETEVDRHGESKVIYSICKVKPNSHSSYEEKSDYQEKIDELIAFAKSCLDSPKILMLTNKSIAKKNNFEKLYKIFDDRYVDVSDRIENYLSLIQVLEICEICYLYKGKQYNSLIKQIHSAGFIIRNGQDKVTLKTAIEYLNTTKELSIINALTYAKEKKLIKESEVYRKTIARNAEFLKTLKANDKYGAFKRLYNEGKNTFVRINGLLEVQSEEEFNSLNNQLKQENFINALFSDKTKFSDALNYYDYLNEETEFITMHKTKGSSIPAVITVMEEFFWNEYDFSLMYSSFDKSKRPKFETSQKLIYVACSRARNSVIC
ncbi:UvrD-helicase domain-containing protein, partial [Chryseobacterium sp.]|uniref:UvrD-helicase domain-containing protein n=1 Tax=Chryseobacterium sp. TaxID=1871047 RepID=UPI002FC6CE57